MRIILAPLAALALIGTFHLAYAAESTADHCTLVVKNCLRSDQGNVTEVRAYNGNDTQHLIAATSHGAMSHGQTAEVSCNYRNCDTAIQTYKAGTIIGFPVHVYDQCTDVTVTWGAIEGHAIWQSGLASCSP